ncbi:MAG: alkaline shock response membrane anchor protein AmaP [Chloroflexi bacterium]|nr:alkaline shock response membrane anchor protein AmaP [Chloroflexota bacterium]
MNVFNRILTILLLLVLLALLVVFAAVPRESVTAVQRGLENAGAFVTQAESAYYWLFIAARIVLGVLAVLLFGWLLWAELRPHRPRAVRVHTEAGSQATVTTDSVGRRLAWHIDQLADVISVTPRVSARGKAVDVLLELETRPEIDVPMKTDEVVSVAREVITERMGLQAGKIEVRIKHAAYQEEA